MMHTGRFLPTTVKEIEALGWDSIDVVLFSGDAYVDHPSFGSALIGRFIESLGLKVALVPQPNWRDDLRDFRKMGIPNYFFAVSAGNLDSMLNHYTPQKRLRSDDAYTAGGLAGQRPDYATVVYSKILKQLYPQTPLIIGGIEASLRRFTHYDYWSDTLKPSILYDSGADFLVYGMAEQTLKEIAAVFTNNKPVDEIKNINQVAYLVHPDAKSCASENIVELPSHQLCLKNKEDFARSFVLAEKEFNKTAPCKIVQQVNDRLLIVNPPAKAMTEAQLDSVYNLPFIRKPHFRYKKNIPAFDMIKDSVTIHRGCFGGCSFCTLAAHQSKFISSRSEASVLNELSTIASDPGFKGHITDLGGPTANMYKMIPLDKSLCDKCSRPSCTFPSLCKNMNNSHKNLISLYRNALKLKGIKKITIGSGIRYDLFHTDNKREASEKGLDTYLELLMSHFVSGRLKVAPEHTSDGVLKNMRKPPFHTFLTFKKKFDTINVRHNLNLQLVPYFISGHPGTTYTDMAELAIAVKQNNIFCEPVQDFTPTPMTLSSVMFYTGMNPYSKEKLFCAKSLIEKENQKKFFFYYKRENKEAITKLLHSIKRGDLALRLFNRK